MSELHLPWLAPAIAAPLLGAIAVRWRCRHADKARQWSIIVAALALFFAVGAWLDFSLFEPVADEGRVAAGASWLWPSGMAIDELTAPLLPIVALLYLLTSVATQQAKIRRFSFAWTLASEGIALATLCCREPYAVIALLAAATVPPIIELRARRKPIRVFAWHMGLFVGLLSLGWTLVELGGEGRPYSLWAVAPLLAAVCIRTGIAPLHCWMTDLFEHATFGTALLYTVPVTGAYAAIRLVLPVAPDGVLRTMGLVALATSVYAGGMALVQREGRRFFCYLLISHSALVLVGLEMLTPIGLTGALCLWLSVLLSLGGLGLTLRAVEARTGRLALTEFHGLYEHIPALAVCFIITGLASVGFPGTFGFVGAELLVDGAVVAYPHVGAVVVIAAALNGIAIVQAYLRLFTGRRHIASVSLSARKRELVAVLTLAALILAGGVYPQLGVASRHRAAQRLLDEREERLTLREDSLASW